MTQNIATVLFVEAAVSEHVELEQASRSIKLRTRYYMSPVIYFWFIKA